MSEQKRCHDELGEEKEDAKKQKVDHSTDSLKFEISPYLYFDGNCREAIDFYVQVFNAKLEFITLYKDAPPSMEVSDNCKERVMHATLKIKRGTDELSIMFSDIHPEMGNHLIGSNIHLSVSMSDLSLVQEVWKKFEEHEKTKITMPLQKQFWGSMYGNLIDPFGVPWMFSAPIPPENNFEDA